MSRAEWLRTFIAVYRAGAVTAGARARGISQPAASQQLAALTKAAGAPLLTRTQDGMVPTGHGRELYARVAESLDRLESVLAELDGGRLSSSAPPTRIGCSADLFEGYVLPRLAADHRTPIAADFSPEGELSTKLIGGEVDLVIGLNPPHGRTAFETRVLGERRFPLVAAPRQAPDKPITTHQDLAEWLSGRAWVSYSHELPVTRRFWSSNLGRTFDADVRLVAPDLRSVTTAVQLGLGVSIIPDYACQHQLADGSLIEICDFPPAIRSEPIHGTIRRTDIARPDLSLLLEQLDRT